MMGLHAATEKASDMLEQGQLADVYAANIEIVRMMGVRLITSRVPRDCRIYLNVGVKMGKLGHLKKDGLKPEAYFHPNSKANAIAARNKAALEAVEVLRTILG
jgi:hypothetical protein